MSTVWYQLQSSNEVIGWVAYQNSADVWYQGIYDKPRGTELGPRSCECGADAYPRADVMYVGREGPKLECRMRWCPACVSLVTPPFDGYVYHNYGCAVGLGKQCDCDGDEL